MTDPQKRAAHQLLRAQKYFFDKRLVEIFNPAIKKLNAAECRQLEFLLGEYVDLAMQEEDR